MANHYPYLYRLMPSDSKLFEKEITFKVEFPFTVSNEIVDKLIKKTTDNDIKFTMYL